MPEDIPGGDMSACMNIMQEERGMDEDSAAKVCQTLRDESKAENGNVEELMDALKRGAGLLADVGVDLNSAVDVPAIDSTWVAMKSEKDGYDRRIDAPLVVKQDADEAADADAEKRITYAPAMIPREPDKEGDVVSTPTVERAAHDYLAAGDSTAIDTDHDLIDGKGTVVESWIEPDAREWDTPSGETKEYPAGTWMLGIKWEADPWARIQNGDLEGLSIYGRAEKVPLARSATAKDLTVPYADEVIVDLVYGAQVAAEKAAAAMGMEETAHEHELDGRTVFMPGPDHDTYVQTYNDIAAGDGEIDASATVKDEDPCWEGYTMVGTDENGDPRCVPEDEVPDADFSESLTPAETKVAAKGTTPINAASESGKQDSMTDSNSGGADGGTTVSVSDIDTDALAEGLAGTEAFTDTVADAVKDALPDDGNAQKDEGMDALVDEFARRAAALDGVDKDSAALADDLRAAIAREDDMNDDDEDDESMSDGYEDKEVALETVVDMLAEHDDVAAGADEIADALEALTEGAGDGDGEETEASADGDSGTTEKASRGNFAKGHGTGAEGASAAADAAGATTENPLSSRADVLDDFGA